MRLLCRIIIFIVTTMQREIHDTPFYLEAPSSIDPCIQDRFEASQCKMSSGFEYIASEKSSEFELIGSDSIGNTKNQYTKENQIEFNVNCRTESIDIFGINKEDKKRCNKTEKNKINYDFQKLDSDINDKCIELFKSKRYQKILQEYESIGNKMIRNDKDYKRTIDVDVKRSRFMANTNNKESSEQLNVYLHSVLTELKCEYIQGMNEIATVLIYAFYKMIYPNDLRGFIVDTTLKQKIVNICSAICEKFILPFFPMTPETEMDIPRAQMQDMFIEHHFNGSNTDNEVTKDNNYNRFLMLNHLNGMLKLYCYSFETIYEYFLVLQVILTSKKPDILCLIYFLYYDGKESENTKKCVIENGILMKILKQFIKHELTLNDFNNLIYKDRLKEENNALSAIGDNQETSRDETIATYFGNGKLNAMKAENDNIKENGYMSTVQYQINFENIKKLFSMTDKILPFYKKKMMSQTNEKMMSQANEKNTVCMEKKQTGIINGVFKIFGFLKFW